MRITEATVILVCLSYVTGYGTNWSFKEMHFWCLKWKHR